MVGATNNGTHEVELTAQGHMDGRAARSFNTDYKIMKCQNLKDAPPTTKITDRACDVCNSKLAKTGIVIHNYEYIYIYTYTYIWIERERERERERDREGERETETETERQRQIDRETGRQRDRIEEQRDRDTHA